ncbi:MAG TPA: outer membrane lipoprotein carrier protein LolA [Fibrobacteria bacterium]|nr:outer membrane lipoprotein carrier protein LolA [Fibrobacteria bacterium]
MKRILAALCLGAALQAAEGQVAAQGQAAQAAPITGRLAAPPVLSGNFVQEKTIVGLKKPLVSRGDFLVVRGKGVIWRTRKPVSAAVSVTPKGIWSLKPSASGLKREAVHQGDLGLAMDMIQKVLSGDPASLAGTFDVKEAGTAAAWSLDLRPLDPVVHRVISSIRLEGGKYVDRVEYAEANGDKTRIGFSAVADSAGELGAWQAAAFGE